MSNRVSKPSTRNRGRKISDQQWDSHRDRILLLWHGDGGEERTLDEIVNIMRQKHNFVATASQYHNRLVKKWNIRKRLTKNEWRKLFWDNIDHEQSGQSYEVLFNGRLISNETRAREWERYAFISESRPRGELQREIDSNLPALTISDMSPLSENFEYRPCHDTRVLESSEKLPNPASNRTWIDDTDRMAESTTAEVSAKVIMYFQPQVLLNMNVTGPFSWGPRLDWTFLAKIMGPGNHIVQAWKPDLNRLNAMFYSQYRSPYTGGMVEQSLLLQYLVSCVVNGVVYADGRNSGDVFLLLNRLPRQTVTRFFKDLPEETIDIVRQRLRKAAVITEDAETVQRLLDLEYVLGGSTCRTETDVFAVMDRLRTCGVDIALVIVRYACRIICRPAVVLDRLLSILPSDYSFRDQNALTLIQILVEAGATVTKSCFLIPWINQHALEKLIGFGKSDILVWMEEGLLTTAVHLSSSTYSKRVSVLVNWILSSLNRLFHQRRAQHTWTEIDATIACDALVNAFQAALDVREEGLIQAIYDISHHLAFSVHYSKSNFNLNSTVMQACSDRDWERACQAISESKLASVSYSISDRDPWEARRKRPEDVTIIGDINEIDDLEGLKDLLGGPLDALNAAISNARDEAAALLATYYGTWGILKLLEGGKAQAISIVLCKYSHWAGTIQMLEQASAFDVFEDILYRKEPHESCRWFPCCLSEPRLENRLDNQQIILQMLGHHALCRNDTNFLDWLQGHGLVTESMVIRGVHSNIQLQAFPCQKSKFGGGQLHLRDDKRLPSLLEVATQFNDTTMLSYLLSRKPTLCDSALLLRAIKARAHVASIKLILQANKHGDTRSRKQYGSGALRLAVRDKNYELISILAQATNIHGLESVDDKDGPLNYLDPFGEAILRKDCIAVEILLENGGDPNAIVAFDGLPNHTPRSANNSVLSRMTALLVAIDVGDFAMVRLLVNKGAQVDREPGMGVLRTPLQRASEIGDFELVRYFIERGATVDAAPVYGGATALQLAAMSGHLGIATLLIEHGANVNHPPARGPGRTAFEAAAEWCRPDMMHLLVQHGVLLDLEVEEEIDEPFERDDLVELGKCVFFRWRTVRKRRTQYERALQFAEDRGEHASKRVVEAIGRKPWGQWGDNVLRLESLQGLGISSS
ncbi:hypothetical protein OPT61_g2562 [Boeremia exigua]|uniref:Uncharacterized protein n=1 Tax=Boeremia exigua TaxID=749465 RepID=A0ACC2ILG2_9PLEO|nr:hypothetical protein OPT61_g2562 [Boeremia exigua]